MPSPSNYPPGVSGNEPEIAGVPEFYLKCRDCGEVFEDIHSASEHTLGGYLGESDCSNNEWEIVPEGEAI